MEKLKKITVNKMIIMDIVLIIKAMAIVCGVIGLFGGFLYGNKKIAILLLIGTVIIFTLHFLTKKNKKAKEIIANTKPHKATKWICYTIIVISLLILAIFIISFIILTIINLVLGFINWVVQTCQAIF